ncbi:hypothetical protein F4677DRAFT_351742 [Hypoxylon crocopeplum]|nr:hypothetical protein F4677DRAFT_351742 [Hypoxylon crocopeplum]
MSTERIISPLKLIQLAIMEENDLMASGRPISSTFISDVAKISKHLINRQEAERWALKDIKFLIYDDTDARIKGYDSDDEEETMNYAIKMSQEDSGVDQENDQKDPSLFSNRRICDHEPGPSTKRDINGSSANGGKFECRICSSCPEFPHNRKPRKFRLFKPSDAFPDLLKNREMPKSVDVCMHYVAVSYCWPVPEKDSDGKTIDMTGTYRIRDLDGTLRNNRAPDDVLDRAVDVANSCGLRMIWIDQECLPQSKPGDLEENRREDQLGVQAMDIVYNRAICTAGLHDVEISNPAQADAIITLIRMAETRRVPRVDAVFLNRALDFLEAVSRDRWYTRAWVVQEALSAGDGLMIVLRRGPAVSYPSCLRSPKFDTPKHSLDHNPRGLPSEVVCILADQFRDILGAMAVLLQREFVSVGQALVRFDNQPATIIERAGPVLAAAGNLHPCLAMPQSSKRPVQVQIYGGLHYGVRQSVDAAGALTLLKTRGCKYQQDRIAIVANMCNYDFRLDTRAVTDSGSLRAGLTALALLNGDYSLLVPEAYGCSRDDFLDPDGGSALLGAGWLSPFDTYPNLIDYVSIRNFNPHKLHVPPTLTESGLSLPSYLWNVESEFDMFPIKYQYEEIWENLKCLQMTVDRQKQETAEEFAARKALLTEHFAKRNILRQAKKDLFLKSSPLSSDSPAWEGLNSAGVQITQRVVAPRVHGEPQMQRIISEVIFSILRYLHNCAKTDPKAGSLATSIWQSLRVATVGGRSDLPDEVSEALFDHPDVIERPFQTLQLDVERNGEYSQLWFIDRIMRHGTLWVGHYSQALSSDIPLRDGKPPISYEIANSPESLKGKEPAVGEGERRPSFRGSNGILHRQTRRQLMTGMYGSMLLEKTEKPSYVVPGTMAGVLEVFAYGLWHKEAEDRRINNLVSTFDVDSPCLVATPYNGNWEMLPHPELRSMSVCWVVESTQPSEACGDLDHGPREEYSQATGSPTETQPVGSSSSSSEAATSQAPETDCPTEEKKAVYRVVNKVRGLWQLMDPPSQKITIV